MIGIAHSVRPQIEYVIITSAFPLDTHTTLRKPDRRVEPIHAADKLHENLRETITAFHMGEFMNDDGAASFVGPGLRTARKQDDRMQPTPGHRRKAATD